MTLTLPEEESIVDQASQNPQYENLYVAIRDAFAAAQHKLKHYAAVHKW